MPYDPYRLTPDMGALVMLGEFHSTHDRAASARKKVESGVARLSELELSAIIQDLHAGQRLSNEETGPDCLYAPEYGDAIKTVLNEFENRKKE